MKTVVVRPIVVLAVVAAAWGQVPAAHAVKGGNHQQTGAHGRVGMRTDGGGRVTVYHQVETDLHTGEVSVRDFTREFDSRGNEVRERFTQTVAGVLVESEDTAFTYGAGHRLSKVVIVSDPDGDGPDPASTRVDTLTRNSHRQLISIVTTIDEDSDGTVDSTSTESRTFGKRGRVIGTRIEDNGIVTQESLTYDAHGNIVARTFDTDDLSTPQSPDQRDTTTSTYDGRGQLVGVTDQSYVFDAAGVPSLAQSNTTTWTLDNKGLITAVHQSADQDGDGHADLTGDSTATYDKQGNLLEIDDTFTDSSGVYNHHSVYTRDKAGNAVTVVTRETLDGAPIITVTETNTFDKFGRNIETVQERDTDGDGDLDASDSIETFTEAYDNKDRMVAATDRVTDGTGTLLYFESDTIAYGKNTETTSRDIDDDGDGTFDRHVDEVSPSFAY